MIYSHLPAVCLSCSWSHLQEMSHTRIWAAHTRLLKNRFPEPETPRLQVSWLALQVTNLSKIWNDKSSDWRRWSTSDVVVSSSPALSVFSGALKAVFMWSPRLSHWAPTHHQQVISALPLTDTCPLRRSDFFLSSIQKRRGFPATSD